MEKILIRNNPPSKGYRSAAPVTVRRRRRLRALTALTVLATHILYAGAAQVEYADARQSAELKVIQGELCAAKQRPPVERPSIEFEVWSEAVKSSKNAREVANNTHEALAIAQDRMGEGLGFETWSLLCDVIAARSRFVGSAAPQTLLVYGNFAVLLRKEGRIAEARRILQLLESIVRKYPPAGASSVRSVLNNLATTLSQQGYYEQAEATFQRALAYSNGADVTTTQTNIAWTLEAREKWTEAEKYHRDVLKARREMGVRARNELAATLTNLGRNLTNQGRPREGEALINEGLDIRKRLLPAGHLNIGYSLAALVQNLIQQARVEDALPLAKELVALRLKGLGSKHSETIEAYQLQAEVLLGLHSFDVALISARAALEASTGLVGREASTLNESARTISRRATADAVLTLARIAWAADKSSKSYEVDTVPAQVDEAFVAAQQALTSSTAEALLSANARSKAKGATQSLVQRYEVNVARRSQLDGDLADAVAVGRPLEPLQAALSKISASTAKVESELRAAYPTYFDLIRPKPVSIKVVAQALKSDETFFLMLPGDDKGSGFVWAVTQREVAWAQITGTRRSLARDVNAFRRLLDPGNKSNDEAGPLPSWSVAHDLHQAIFSAPQLARLGTSSQHWLLAPQGVLVSLPFSALLMVPPPQGLAPWPAAASLRSQRWLGLSKDLTIVPSVAGLRALRSEPSTTTRPTRPFFGLGDPYFSASRAGRLFEARSLRSVSASDLQSLRELDPLPGTRAEIQGLAKLLGASPEAYILGRSANDRELAKRIASNQLRDAKVLAFATHGLMGFELDSIAEPALVLSPPEKATPTDDGLLTASDVARLKLGADVILLSACNTAAGERPSLEGMTGLARSFLFAGAKSLLISHWRVSDSVAPKISTRFIELSRSTQRPASGAAALRQSMLEIAKDPSRDEDNLRTLAHPSAWAAFAYVGAD